MKHCFLIYNKDNQTRIANCISAVLDQQLNDDFKGHTFKVYVFDDSSKDNSVDIIKAFSDVTLIQDDDIQGIAQANNVMLKVAKDDINPDSCFFMDSNIVVTPNILNNSIKQIVEDKKSVLYYSHFKMDFMYNPVGADFTVVAEDCNKIDSDEAIMKIPNDVICVTKKHLSIAFDSKKCDNKDVVMSEYLKILRANKAKFGTLPAIYDKDKKLLLTTDYYKIY